MDRAGHPCPDDPGVLAARDQAVAALEAMA